MREGEQGNLRACSWGWDKQDKQLMWGGLRMAAGIASLVKLSMERTDRH